MSNNQLFNDPNGRQSVLPLTGPMPTHEPEASALERVPP